MNPDESPLTSLYSFWSPERNAALVRRGYSPWWLPEDARVDFFRPVAAATHMLDAAVAPGAPVAAHLHNILWGALLALGAGLLYQRLYGAGATAGLAALLFALNDAHGTAVAWVANRNGLVAGVLGIAALAAHDAWRRRGARPAALMAPGLFATALLSAEGAVAVAAYLFAYAVCLDSGPPVRRAASLAPYAAVALVWRAVYDALGYGTAHTGVYLDPVAEPVAFLEAAALRFPGLLTQQWLSLPAGVGEALPPTTAAVYGAFAWLALLGLALALWPLLRRSAEARFFGLGSVLAVVPLCASVPQSRLLTFASLGATALLAQLLCRVGIPRGLVGERAGDGPPPGRAVLGLAYFLVFVHLVAAPVLSVLGQYSVRMYHQATLAPVDAAVSDAPAIASRTAVFVNGKESGPSYLGYERRLEGRPEPASVLLLAPSVYEVSVTGVDARSLRVRVDGGWHSAPLDQRIRRPSDSLPVGARVEVEAATLTVAEHTPDGLVAAVLVRFHVPLDDPSLEWFATTADGIEPFEPPAPGETRVVAPPRAR